MANSHSNAPHAAAKTPAPEAGATTSQQIPLTFIGTLSDAAIDAVADLLLHESDQVALKSSTEASDNG